MYYEEKLINGVLFWRDREFGPWLQISSHKMTADLLHSRNRVDTLIRKVKRLEQEVSALQRL